MFDGATKYHLKELPPLSVSPSRLTHPQNRGIVLIPVFEGHPHKRTAEHHVIVSAAWARRSWMEYSDAKNFGIEVKLYIEERLREQDGVMETLRENHIGEEDILWFNADHLEGALPHPDGGYVTFGTKKCTMFTDRQLQDYEWVFQFDSDIFVMQSSKKLPFFQRFFECAIPDQIGLTYISSTSGSDDLDWGRDWSGKRTDVAKEAWKTRSKALLGEQKYKKYGLRHGTCHGGFTAFPAKHFMTARWEDCEFLAKAAWAGCGSEVAMSYWLIDNEAFSIEKMPIRFVLLLTSHCNKGLAEGLARFQDLCERDVPFVLHYANRNIDYIWQKGIGVYEI